MELFELELTIGDNKDFQIALVDEPAIESDWIAFGKQDQKFIFTSKDDSFRIVSRDFKIESESERIISGYAMIANLEIPRFDEQRGAYNVVFKKESIKDIWLNFHRSNLNTNTNVMHQTNEFAEGVFVCESTFLDAKRGAKPHEGFNVEADGSWFISMKVENDKIWDQVKNGTFRGFSIEGRFKEMPAKMEKDNFLEGLKNIIKNSKMNKPSLGDKIKEYFKSNPEAEKEVKDAIGDTKKFESVTLVDGDTVLEIEPAVEVGAAVVVMTPEGEPEPAPAGEWELQDGRVIVIIDPGVIDSVVEVATDEESEEEEMGEESPEQQKVKRVIERIETEKTFETVKFLKEENETLKKDLVDLKDSYSKDFEEFKKELTGGFESLKEFSKETFEALLDEPAKKPVKEAYNPFKREKKGNIFLKTKT